MKSRGKIEITDEIKIQSYNVCDTKIQTHKISKYALPEKRLGKKKEERGC